MTKALNFSVSFESRFFIALLLCLFTFIIASSIGNGWVLFLSTSLLTTLFLSILLPALQLINLVIDTTAPDKINVGEFLTINIFPKSNFFSAKDLIMYCLKSNSIDYLRLSQRKEKEGQKEQEDAKNVSLLLIDDLTNFRTNNLSNIYLNNIVLRRGKHTLPSIQVESSFPFGFVWIKRQFVSTKTVLVLPEILPITGQLLYKLNSASYVSGDLPGKKTGHHSSATKSIRPYTRGDSKRNIHWSLSARHQKLIVKEREEEGLPCFDLILELNSHYLNEEQAELAITTAASLLNLGFKLGIHPKLYLFTNNKLNSANTLEEQLDILAKIQFSKEQLYNFSSFELPESERALIIVKASEQINFKKELAERSEKANISTDNIYLHKNVYTVEIMPNKFANTIEESANTNSKIQISCTEDLLEL